jgi:hypothetical protein
MATLTFNIPDERMPDLIEAWGDGWTADVIDPDNPGEYMPNPLTKPQYAKEQIRRSLVQRVKQFQAAALEDIPIT